MENEIEKETPTEIDTVSQYAAVLSAVEVSLGAIVHGFKIPLGGHVLSLNQTAFLSQVAAQSKSLIWAPMTVSSISAVLKSLSPAGNKLGPMLSISAQGFLFNFPLVVLGRNWLALSIGAFLMSLWAFLQPIMTLYIFFGRSIESAGLFYLQKMEAQLPGASQFIFSVILSLVVVKGLVAVGVAIHFYRMKESDFSQYTNRFSKTRWVSLDSRAAVTNREILFAVVKDMTRPLFLISFLFMFVFFAFSVSDYSQMIWLSLRPVAVAFLFFFISRHPWFYRIMQPLRQTSSLKGFFRVFDGTMKHLSENLSRPQR